MKRLEEAIERFETSINLIGDNKQALGYVEDLKLLIEASRYRIAEKPVEVKLELSDGIRSFYDCPECGSFLATDAVPREGLIKFSSYCEKCGKRVDW